MKCLILAAGYATRLYPLTENFPKPLLKVGEKTILDWLVDDIDQSGRIDEYIVISNHKYADCFREWIKEKKQRITLLDDGTISNETRLGAVTDILFAIEQLQLEDDLLVIAGDNVLDFSLNTFIAYAEEKKTACVMRYFEADEKKLRKCGVAQIDENDLIVDMEEKPENPKSNWCTPPFYYYPRGEIAGIRDAVRGGCGTDAPGSLVVWFAKNRIVHAMEMPGNRYDIGNLQSYENVQKNYKGIRLTPNIDLNGKKILVTGAAGFIGSCLARELLRTLKGAVIVGLDNVNDYYDVSLKEYRLDGLTQEAEKSGSDFVMVRGSIADGALIDRLFCGYRFDVVVNLAAQAGVRYSIDHPDVYIESNIIGFYRILEACRHYPVAHLVYASSSSVYGGNTKIPFSTEDRVDNPVSLYAATKKSNELMAHAYSKLYNIPSTGLRFFTVYGPAGRPDMAYFSFTDKLLVGEKIKIFNYGNCERDFTYVDDIVKGILHVMRSAPEKKNGADGLPLPPYRVYNIGNSHPENLLDFVRILSEELVSAGVLPSDYDFEAHKELVPMQPGDVPVTFADTAALERDFGYKPSTSLRDGLRAFAQWYKAYYGGKE